MNYSHKFNPLDCTIFLPKKTKYLIDWRIWDLSVAERFAGEEAQMGRFKSLLFMLIILTLSRSCMCWWFSSSSSKTTSHKPQETLQISGDVPVIFSTEAFHDQRAIQRKEVADRRKLESCWFDAYRGLFAACSEISSDKNDMKKRFSWELSNCFQREIGRPPFPTCREGSPMKDCLAKLDDNAIETYRAFFIETDSICFQLQLSLICFQLEFANLLSLYLSLARNVTLFFWLMQVSCI